MSRYYPFFSILQFTNAYSGMPGHINMQCSRPNLEICSRNEETLLMEIERAATVRSVEQSIVDANHSKQQVQLRGNNNQQTRQNDTANHRYHRGGNGATTVQQGQSRYGSIDQSRNNSNHSSSSSLQPYDRGRQMDREQPQFRPFKSMPPPKRQHHQHSNYKNDNNNSRNYYNSDQQNNNHKRNRDGGGGSGNSNNNDPDLSPPHHKRRRPN